MYLRLYLVGPFQKFLATTCYEEIMEKVLKAIIIKQAIDNANKNGPKIELNTE